MIGPTGGYLIGFITSVFIAGFVNLNKNIFVKFILISVSIFAIYITGVPWLAYLAGWEIAYVLKLLKISFWLKYLKSVF